jgi:hypothetical protein
MINTTPTIGIYKITSPSGKIYIGQSVNIFKRFKQYVRFDCKKQIQLYNSLKKYGWEQHTFEVIETCLIEQLDGRETFHKQQFINEFGWDNALFCQLIDGKGGYRSEETKQKISKSQKGKKYSLGIKQTDEHKSKRFRKSLKPILQYDLEGNFIKEWPSIVSASKTLNVKGGNISECCRGNQKTSKKYIWKFK